MDAKYALKQFGLTGKKADVYLATLELGSASVIDIAQKAAIKRTTCYDVLLDLSNDGLVSQTKTGKKRHFVGEDPDKILRSLKNKERLFSEILPELQSIHNSKAQKPKIRYYEGKAGLKDVYEDTLIGGSEILIFGSYDVVNALGADWAEDYLKKRVAKKISAKAILPGSDNLIKEYISKDKEQLRASKLISPKKYPFSIEINIYAKNKLALISSKEEIALIIEGAEIHKTLRLMFELIWDLLPDTL